MSTTMISKAPFWLVLLSVLSTIFLQYGSCQLDHVRLLNGRFDTDAFPSMVQFSWSATSFAADLNCIVTRQGILRNITVELVMSDYGNWYNVELFAASPSGAGGKLLANRTISTTNAVKSKYITGFDQIPSYGQYVVRVTKRTEGYFGAVQLFQFVARSNDGSCSTGVAQGVKLQKRVSPPLKIEWIGDSLSCAFGIEGKSPCNFSPNTENAQESFVVKASLSLDPDAIYNVVCYSGKGVVRNYGDKKQMSADPMPTYYNKTLTTRNILWDFKSYVPDIVVITLGGNDFSTEPRPSFEQYSHGYNQLIDYLQNVYGRKKIPIVTVCGPLSWDCFGDYTQKVVEQRGDDSVYFVSLAGVLDGQDPGPDYGCSGHPSVQGSVKMSVKLSSHLRNILDRHR